MSSKNIQERDKPWADIATQIAAGQERCRLRSVILAAHPDDEVLGASVVLLRSPEVHVVYLTDGAPIDPRFRLLNLARAQYADLRRKESTSALALVPRAPHVHFLGGTDQEAVHKIASLAERFVILLRAIRPDIIVTHPYEGGHPDHDTAALVASLSINMAATDDWRPALLEMTSYHAQDKSWVNGVFLPQSAHPTSPQLDLYLSHDELATKKLMLGCHASQKSVIEPFRIQPERLRPAPHYDFSQPPHEGLLWYECLRWAMTGAQWRALAASALMELHAEVCR